MFENVIAADMGSANTRLATRRETACEETRAALDMDDHRCVLAVGSASRRLLNAVEVYPVRGGVSDITLAAIMLRRFALSLTKRKTLAGMSLLLAVPADENPLKKQALAEVAREAGFRRVRLVKGLLAGAEGAGVDVNADRASLLVDIGRETTGILVCANGGAVLERSIPVGSHAVDKRIMAWFAEEHGELIASQTAEQLKKRLASPVLRVSVRTSRTGVPVFREVASAALMDAAMPAVRRIAAEIAFAIESLPPECAADLVDSGAVLIGGGAKQFGLAESLEKLLGISVRPAPNADSAVITGLQSFIRKSSGLSLEALAAV